MRHFIVTVALIALLDGASCVHAEKQGCSFGVFIKDAPRAADIREFGARYGKKPALVMVFVDWGRYARADVMKDIYSEGARVVVTWEPWDAALKQGIDPDGILAGKHDDHINEFARSLQKAGGEVFLRFAHEMNGNWYPWSAGWGHEKYIAVWRYIHGVFAAAGVDNVRWVFAVNAEDVPADNRFVLYYPGDEFVDYIGIDGYNWGATQTWSRWRSFKDIMDPAYQQAGTISGKPIMISEFGSTGKGGNKAVWIREAMQHIKTMERVRAVVLFNVDKETDWSFAPGSAPAREFKKQLKDAHFKGAGEGI